MTEKEIEKIVRQWLIDEASSGSYVGPTLNLRGVRLGHTEFDVTKLILALTPREATAPGETVKYALQKVFNMRPEETDQTPLEIIAAGLEKAPYVFADSLKSHSMDLLLYHNRKG